MGPTILLTALLLATPPQEPAPKAFAFPTTPAGEMASAWFAALADGSQEALLGFETTHREPGQLEARAATERAGFYRVALEQLGALEPLEVLEDAPASVLLLARAPKAGVDLELRVEVQPDPPHKLVGLTLEPAGSRLSAYDEWTDLAELLERVRADTGVPALAVAVFDGHGLGERAVVGPRRNDEEAAAELEDLFHIGSLTKPITATMIARLVERDVLAWDITIAEGLPGLDVRAEYRERTLADLLHHRAGLASHLSFNAVELARMNGLEGDETTQRRAFAAEVLQAAPATDGGFLYSNAGYTVAAAIAERATGESWEELVQQHVFGPLGMESAGFGWPVREDRRDQPWGHQPAGGGKTFRPVPIGVYDVGAFAAPAGGVCCSIEDLARFARAHLRGLEGEDGLLRAETVRWLHAPGDGAHVGYAAGWIVEDLPGGGTRHWHNGSLGTFYAYAEIRPEEGVGLVVALNAPDQRERIPHAISDALARRRAREAPPEAQDDADGPK